MMVSSSRHDEAIVAARRQKMEEPFEKNGSRIAQTSRLNFADQTLKSCNAQTVKAVGSNIGLKPSSGEIVAASKRQKIGEVHEKNGCSRGQGSRPSAGVFDDGHESEEDGGPITFRRSSVLSKTKADMQKGGTSKDTSSIGEENSVSKLAKSEMRLHAKNLASTLGAAVSCPNTGTLLDPVIDSHSKQPKSTSTLPSNPLPQKKSSISSAVFSNNGGGKSTSVSVNPNSSGPKTMRTPSGFSGHSENNTASVSESKSVPDHLMHISSNELQDSLQEKAPRVLSGTTIRQSLKRSSMEQALNNTHSSEVSIVAMTKDSDEVKSVLPHVKSSSNYENDDIDSDEDKPLSSRLAASSLVPTKEIATLRKSTAFMLESSAKMISLEEENSGSEDDKPLSERLLSYKAATARPSLIDSIGRNGHFKDVCDKLGKPSKLACAKDASDDESDDDKPLSQRLNPKVSMKAVGLGTVHSGKDLNDEKPLSEKIVENASMKLQKKEMISKFSNKKRPHDQNSVPASAAKKLKVSPETAKLQVKHRLEVPSDDEDEVPLSKRIPQSFSTNKPVITKKVSSGVTIATKKVLEARRAKTGQMKKALTTKSRISMPKGAPGSGGGQKWTTLEHNGVIFPPPYQVHGIKMLYDGKPVDLTPEQEEVATMFAVMKDTDYASKPKFISNFWSDWKQILGLNHIIKKLEHCDFTPIYEWHLREKEKKKSMSALEKKRIKEEKLNLEEKYMWALVDGVKEKVGNFRVEPPGLFRGRGEHPKMGKLKKRIFPENIVINVGKDAPIPDCPMPGHRWKEVRRDNTVTWLAYWNDPINSKEFKYVFLAPSSSLKGQSDKEKYEKSRKLKDYIEDIRKTYTKGFSSSDSIRRQIAVATYLIDRLALRAGNEKDDDEADTVGCCSLKVEHVSLIPPHSLEFDFLGKDSIRYFNTVEVEERVYKAIGDFKKSKKDGDDLFDKLDTSKLNAHLKEIMPGLTAKVFRTYNASITLDTQLQSANGDTVTEKIAAYQGANKEVAILCNHQRSVSKSHSAQMERLESKMAELEALRVELKRDLDRARKGKPPLKDADGKSKRNQTPEALQKKIDQTDQKIEKMKLDMRIKDDLKTVALGTSKINYMDPRITVAWCKRHEVPIEKIFNKSLLAKFSWAMDVEPDFRF